MAGVKKTSRISFPLVLHSNNIIFTDWWRSPPVLHETYVNTVFGFAVQCWSWGTIVFTFGWNLTRQCALLLKLKMHPLSSVQPLTVISVINSPDPCVNLSEECLGSSHDCESAGSPGGMWRGLHSVYWCVNFPVSGESCFPWTFFCSISTFNPT